MYDHILGECTDKLPARVVLRAGGIGYELKVPVNTSAQLKLGETAQLFTILHVVDGTPTLLGFKTPRDRELARRLMTVSGVGPTMALAILSTYAPAQIGKAIVEGDAPTLKRVKGVGAKTAERLCLELRDAITKLDLGLEEAPSEDPVLIPAGLEDAIQALVMLGYSEKDARTRTEKVAKSSPDLATDELIRGVLRG